MKQTACGADFWYSCAAVTIIALVRTANMINIAKGEIPVDKAEVHTLPRHPGLLQQSERQGKQSQPTTRKHDEIYPY